MRDILSRKKLSSLGVIRRCKGIVSIYLVKELEREFCPEATAKDPQIRTAKITKLKWYK